MSLPLVVLAAGMGRRYGGLKQLEAPLDSAVFDARCWDTLLSEVLFQEIDDLPREAAEAVDRNESWGTGHAVWCARSAVVGPFAVISADDFSDRDSFPQIAGRVRTSADGKHPAALRLPSLSPTA